MRNETTVSKWGTSLAIRIPQQIAKEARLNEGDRLALAVDRDRSIVLRSTRPKYELSELVSAITPKNRHQETRWRQPKGKESWRRLRTYQRQRFRLVDVRPSSREEAPESAGHYQIKSINEASDGDGLREVKEQMEDLYSAQILKGTLMTRRVHAAQFRVPPSSRGPIRYAFADIEFDAPGR
jgi:antitoxin MazE